MKLLIALALIVVAASGCERGPGTVGGYYVGATNGKDGMEFHVLCDISEHIDPVVASFDSHQDAVNKCRQLSGQEYPTLSKIEVYVNGEYVGNVEDGSRLYITPDEASDD